MYCIGKTTTYSYDENSNLESCIYPNGVKQRWEYDENNRLVNLSISKINGGEIIRSYAYTLGATGNRVKVVENSGRTVEWSYDDLYRLTRETVTNSTTSPNYSAGYSYDAVGNRQSRIVTPTGILPQLANQDFIGDYDENDRLLEGYEYNNNGATVSAPDGWAYTYDAENHLLTAEKAGVNINYIYDGDGIRIAKIVNGVITRYLTDSENPTGYVQVVEELDSNNEVIKRYIYGLDLISQTEVGTGSTQYYIYDGTGSTRMLVDSSGNITDTYDYDAFGAVIYHTGMTGNKYLFHGEEYDEDLGLYYLRARWMNGGIGRFVGMDEFEGNNEEPMSLHKYMFVVNDPVNKQDPSGNFSIGFSIMSLPAFNEFSSVASASFVIDVKMPFLFIPPTQKGHRQLLGLMFAESGGPTAGEGDEIINEKIAIGAVVMNRIYYVQKGLSMGLNQNFKDFGAPDVWSIIKHPGQFGSIGNQHWNMVFNGDDLKSYDMLRKDLKNRLYREKYNQCHSAVLQLIYSGGPPYTVADFEGQIPIGFHDWAKTGLYSRAVHFKTLGANEFWKFIKGREYK